MAAYRTAFDGRGARSKRLSNGRALKFLGGAMDEATDGAIDKFMSRTLSPRSHFVGFLSFWSLWTLSVPFWKATAIAFFVTSLMIFQLERRFVTVCVLILTMAAVCVFLGISLGDLKRVVSESLVKYGGS
jgi:hypothetical protein